MGKILNVMKIIPFAQKEKHLEKNVSVLHLPEKKQILVFSEEKKNFENDVDSEDAKKIAVSKLETFLATQKTLKANSGFTDSFFANDMMNFVINKVCKKTEDEEKSNISVKKCAMQLMVSSL